MPHTVPTNRFELLTAVHSAPTLWDLTCALLGFWRSSGPHTSHAHTMTGEPYLAWGDLVHRTVQHFAGPRTAEDLDQDDRNFVVRTTGGGKVADAVHAVAWGLSLATSHTFAPAWRDELHGGPHMLAHGHFFPVADAPWRDLGSPLSSRPASLAAPAVDELPTVRVHDAAEFDVTVDFTLGPSLEAVLTGLDRVAAGHPNELPGEFHMPCVDRQYFPVGPADAAVQQQTLLALLDQALDGGASVTVLPELAATAQHVEALASRLEDWDEPHLLVAGSRHEHRDGLPENIATGLVAGHETRMEQLKATPFSEELSLRPPSKEGIQHRARPHIVVHQADRFRVALVICKDFLDGRVGRALDRMGVNVILVPALSHKTAPFVTACGTRVSGAQALSVVVNGPLRGTSGEPVEPAVALGQPVEGHEAVAVHRQDPAPRLTFLDLPVVQTP